MRRLRLLSRSTLLVVAVGAVAALAGGAAVAAPPVPDAPPADLPSGFTDGEPVGPSDGAGGGETTSEDDVDRSTSRAAPITRYFGRAPWDAIVAAAAAAPRSCTLSTTGLTALAVSPVFKESSAATSPSTAPSPMTLARYDEWDGVLATTTNRSANHGLYAFRTPSTPYPRAFWHAGIGIWQYDSAGVGAPFTAIERMDVRVVAADVASGMAARYCSPSASLIGHPAPFTDQERRNAAWSPWGYPCAACQAEFDDLTASSPAFGNVTLVDGISVTGGAQERTCTLVGVVGTVPCWYVDPSPGTIEGATAWATIAPLDGGSPTVAPTPLAAPFYVLDRGATEERHFLAADSGYAIDIHGVRTVGTNERPRSNQPGSGVTWSRGSGLCDVARGVGACVPPAPAGLASAPAAISGTFRSVVLDVHGDEIDDVLWIAPGPAADHLWSGRGDGTFASSPANVGGDFDDIVVLDVDADGDDDLLWYARTTGTSYLWRSNGDGTWATLRLARPAGLRPIPVDTDGDGRTEVLWYGPGSLPDALWEWSGSAFSSTPQSIAGSYLGLPADLDGDGRTDVFWYAPGAAADSVWLSTGLGRHRSVAATVSGAYWPLVADLDGDRADDVFWYGPGSAPDSVWFGRSGGGFTKVASSVSGSYQPVLADLEGDGRTDLLWYAPGPATDRWWRWGADRSIASAAVVASGPHQAVVGRFGAPGAEGIVWYAPGPSPDGTWYRPAS